MDMESDVALPTRSLEVVALVRPLRDEEWDSGSSLSVNGSQICVEALADKEPGHNSACLEESFAFDRCFNGMALAKEAKEAAVGSDTALPLITAAKARCEEQLFWERESCWGDAVRRGQDACVIAYGQRRAGKSQALLGAPIAAPERPGVLQRVTEELLRRQAPGHALYFSAFEVLPTEELRDTLCAPPTQSGGSRWQQGSFAATPPLAVVEHPALGVFVAGLTEVACTSTQNVQELVRHCQRERAAAATSIGCCGQAHAMYMLRMQRGGSSASKACTGDTSSPSIGPSCSRVLLADLAGSNAAPDIGGEGSSASTASSELIRRATGARPVNEGLSALHQSVRMLTEGKRHIAGSRLTQILRGGLSGEWQTTFIAALSPAWCDLEESRRTLRFAAAVKRLPAALDRQRVPVPERLGHAEVVEQLREQVQHLRFQLAADVSSGQALLRSLASWEWVLERYSLEGPRPHDLTELRELEAAHRRRGFLTSPPAANVDGAPYLANLSSDAQLRGALIFPLRRPPAHTGLVTVGTHRDCGIVLSGVGIPSKLCEITVASGDEVTLRLMPSLNRQQSCRCAINGGLVRRGAEAKAEHGDRVIFGWSHAFQLCAPERAERLGLPPSPALVTEEDAQSELNADESETYSELSLYIEDFHEKTSEDVANKFLALLREACFYVDEANEIMKDMRPDLQQKFEVDFVWDIFRRVQDVIVIRLIQRPTYPESDEATMVLYYWTFSKFCERLVAMRAVHNSFVHAGAWEMANNPFQDPWMEASLLDFREKLKEEKAKASPQFQPQPLLNSTSTAISRGAEPSEHSPQVPCTVSVVSSQILSTTEPSSARTRRTPSAGKGGVGGGGSFRAPARTRTSAGIPQSQQRRSASGHTAPSTETERNESARSGERRALERSSSPVEVQSRQIATTEISAELERWKREAQRHNNEVRRLRAEAQQAERERKLQDQLVESLRSQLKDKTELVSTLREIVQDRTNKCEELTRADGLKTESSSPGFAQLPSRGRGENLQSSAGSLPRPSSSPSAGSFNAPASRLGSVRPQIETCAEDLTPACADTAPLASSFAFALPCASGGTGETAAPPPGPVPHRAGGSVKAFVNDKPPPSPSDEVMLESPLTPRTTGSPVTVHTIESMALRDPISYQGSSISCIPYNAAVPVVTREAASGPRGSPIASTRTTSPHQHQPIRVASPSAASFLRTRSPTPTGGQMFKSARIPAQDSKQFTARVLAPASPVLPITRTSTTSPRATVGSTSPPRLASPGAVPVRTVAWSTASGGSTTPRTAGVGSERPEVQERVIRTRIGGSSVSQV